MQQYSLFIWFQILITCLLSDALSGQNQAIEYTVSSLDQMFAESSVHIQHTNILYTYPKENQVVYHKNVSLSWQKTDQAMSQLQVAKDENFSEIILDTTLVERQYTMQNLEKHREYFWRVFDPKNKVTSLENGSFFKTSAIMVDETNISSIDIIPTWVDGQDVLFLYNPLQTKYAISILDDQNNIVAKKFLALEKYFISTLNWKNGMYKIHLDYDGHTVQTKYFMLK